MFEARCMRLFIPEFPIPFSYFLNLVCVIFLSPNPTGKCCYASYDYETSSCYIFLYIFLWRLTQLLFYTDCVSVFFSLSLYILDGCLNLLAYMSVCVCVWWLRLMNEKMPVDMGEVRWLIFLSFFPSLCMCVNNVRCCMLLLVSNSDWFGNHWTPFTF